MNRILSATLVLVSAVITSLSAQSTGGLTGKVVDATNDKPIKGVEVRLDNGRYQTVTDTGGVYNLRGIPAGPHTLAVTLPGFRAERRTGIDIRGNEITRADVRMAPFAVQLDALRAVGVQDPVTDPMASSSAQRITADEIRQLPVTSLDDAIAMQAGVVGESYRGGRPGQQAFILDGFGVKNGLDASTNGTGLKIPPDIITEASLITNGFSARYGQAISGLINVTTRDGGDSWHGRTAYQTDRPISGTGDVGIDRMVLQADGPIAGRVTAVAIVDLTGQLDGDPVSAPRPSNPLDPRYTTPAPLPHNSAETWTAGGKLTMPIGERVITRIFGLKTTDQRFLYDPAYKYDPNFGPGSRTDGSLLTGHLQLLPARNSHTPVLGDFRVGYFDRSFVRGTVDAPDYKFGAFTGKRLSIKGEDLAKTQDTIGTRAVIPGFDTPQFATNTPYGVPGFFLSGASSGDIAWNRFTELRSQVDLSIGSGSNTDFFIGGMFAKQTVKTFQRVFGYLPSGGAVPKPTASNFSPTISGLYAEGQARASDIVITAGVRYDGFDPGTDLANNTLHSRSSINPRVAVSTVLAGATVVASIGKFSQPPDLQYLIDAAFDDTLRTGRFRQGNADLGFESATQFELSARVRLPRQMSVKVNVYDKRLDGLVASVPINVNPDSSVFVNADIGEVIGAEVIFERERRNGWGARLVGVVQRANATVTNAFELRQLVIIDPITHDTVAAGRSTFPLDYDRRIAMIATVSGELPRMFGPRILGMRPFASLEMAAVGRYNSGLPYSRTNTKGDSLVGDVNGSRLPDQFNIDALIRRPFRLGGSKGGFFVDVRNVLGTVNQTSVRRDTGTPFPTDQIVTSLATAAYNAHPDPIPYESPRYRSAADLNHDGIIAGQSELLPMFMAAARDYTQPLFLYGPPRIVRFGIEILF